MSTLKKKNFVHFPFFQCSDLFIRPTIRSDRRNWLTAAASRADRRESRSRDRNKDTSTFLDHIYVIQPNLGNCTETLETPGYGTLLNKVVHKHTKDITSLRTCYTRPFLKPYRNSWSLRSLRRRDQLFWYALKKRRRIILNIQFL